MDKKKVLGISFGRKMGNTDVMIKTDGMRKGRLQGSLYPGG